MARASTKKHRGVYEHPAGSEVWWVCYFCRGCDRHPIRGRHREKVGGKQAAIDRYQERKTQARKGTLPLRKPAVTPVEQRPGTVEQFVAEYLDTVKLKRASWSDMNRHGRVWSARFKGRALTSILPLEVEKWAAKRAQHVSHATVNRELAFLRRLFNVAKRNKLVTDNPVEADHFYDEPEGRVRFLSDEEELRLRGELDAASWKVVRFAMASGLRQGAQEHMHWTKVDLANGVVEVRKKRRGGVAVQRLTLTPAALDILRSLKSRFKRGAVWLGPTGVRLNFKNFERRVFKPALERAGIEDFRWHDLRHTFGSRLVMRGATPKEIKELMGHASVTMSDKYMHLSPTHLRDAARRYYDSESGGTSGGTTAAHSGASQVTHTATKRGKS